MADDAKIEPVEVAKESDEEQRLLNRRNFLVGLRKWSTIIIGGALLSSILPESEASAWVNGGGGGWVNARGGGGGAGWVNKAGGGGAGWVNKSGGGTAAGWVNARGGWVNGAGWINR